MTGQLRDEAATLMRHRAAAASTPPWRTYRVDHYGIDGQDAYCGIANDRGMIAQVPRGMFTMQHPHADAEHVASWHPLVALAVADLVACPCQEHADAVARAYLGHDA